MVDQLISCRVDDLSLVQDNVTVKLISVNSDIKERIPPEEHDIDSLLASSHPSVQEQGEGTAPATTFKKPLIR